MIGMAWQLARTSGRGRAILVASCTAGVTGLLLVAISILRLPSNPEEPLYQVVSDIGTRGGFVFGTVLLVLPPLLLLFQAVRLGTSARERRLAALRLAGATPSEVRRLGAYEVGIPAFVGSAAGYGIYLLLRALLGGDLYYSESFTVDGERYVSRSPLRLVPTTVGPTWWQFGLTVLAVTVLGILVGMAASRAVTVSPIGLARRASSRPPRPWGFLVMAAGVAVAVGTVVFWRASAFLDLVAPFVSILLLIVGIISLAPWTAYAVGRRAARKARTGHALLAARRLAADPRPAGRAAAAVGAIGLVTGGAAVLSVDILRTQGGGDRAYYLIGLALVGIALLLALITVVGSLAVHSVESLLDRKRSVASLGALGGTSDLLARTQRAEVGLVAMPMGIGGTLFGATLLGIPLTGLGLHWAAATLVAGAVVAGLVWVAIRISVLLTRPWIRAAADPANLRTA